MTLETPVDRIFKESALVIRALDESKEYSLSVGVADHLRKALLLAAASYFEHRVIDCVMEHVRSSSNGSRLIEAFVRNKAVSRQYHTWFNWSESNANQFFGLFGSDFKSAMTQRVRASAELTSSVSAFLQIGSERNRLIHENYATFPFEKTLEEVYTLYKIGSLFVDALPHAFKECDSLSGSSVDESGHPSVPYH